MAERTGLLMTEQDVARHVCALFAVPSLTHHLSFDSWQTLPRNLVRSNICSPSTLAECLHSLHGAYSTLGRRRATGETTNAFLVGSVLCVESDFC